MINTISTVDMPHEEWLKHRKNAIGGSDASTICGLNPYSSLYELWADKLSKIPPKEENEAMRIGHDLEDYVAKRFSEATGKRVRRKNAIIYNTDFPFAHANVDRLIVGENAGLECKTTSVLNLSKFRDGEFPATYYVQCQHYMMVTGIPKWYLAVLVLGREFLWFEIERNEDDIAALADMEKDFWEYVDKQEEPPVDGSRSCTDTIGRIYTDSHPETVDAALFRDELVARSEVVRQIKELEKLRDQYDNEIKTYMQEADTAACDGFKITWKAQTRRTFDVKRFAAENPDIDLSEYYKETESRVFKVKEDK